MFTKENRELLFGAAKGMDEAVSAPCLTKQDVESVLLAAETKESEGGGLYGSKNDPFVRRCRIAWRPSNDIREVYQKVFAAIDLINSKNWNIGFDSLNTAQFTEYGVLGHYGTHIDLGSGDIRNRKLSASVNLSDHNDYMGGRLWTWKGEASEALGSITVFPAYLPHRVNPVWWGKRRSLVFWATGVPFS